MIPLFVFQKEKALYFFWACYWWFSSCATEVVGRSRHRQVACHLRFKRLLKLQAVYSSFSLVSSHRSTGDSSLFRAFRTIAR